MPSTQHHLDPMTPEERAEADEKFMAWASKKYGPGQSVWMKTTHLGTWHGSYCIGDFSAAVRLVGYYRFVGRTA